jgi:predicted molibdopterin-dependent oxidoreductase YjgC
VCWLVPELAPVRVRLRVRALMWEALWEALMSNRVAEPKLDIVIDGERVSVAAGTTVAAALFDHGVSAFRRSVSGEPRSPVCCMGVCFECRVTIDSRPHRRACMTVVADGMRVQTAMDT